MGWLRTIDESLFRGINHALANPVGDWLLPRFDGNQVIVPLVVVALALLAWRGGRRGLLCAGFILLAVLVTDGLVCNTLKELFGRPRPYLELNDVRLLVPAGRKPSLPSSHAANCFAAAMVAFIFYRRSARVMLPFAALVAFSRVYVGAHYPSDVLAGAVLGAGTAAALVLGAAQLWQWAGPRWFRAGWQRLPSLLEPERGEAPGGAAPTMDDGVWWRLGYGLIAVLLLARWAYLAAGRIGLSDDEAYQWVWSKHLALSYFSKPPMIAYLQFLGTSLFGDTVFGVRFLSPVIAALTSLVLLRFAGRLVSPRAGFWLVAISSCAPMLAVGATLMTVDPPLVLFWTLAMLSGWKALQPEACSCDWVRVGLWMGLAFLSKYSALFQLVSFALAFALLPATRVHLRRPGPYAALLVMVLFSLPVVIWNQQHQWVTAAHVAEDAAFGREWKFTLKYFYDFTGAQAALLNPVFFLGLLATAVTFWRRRRTDLKVYLFCMGAPVFAGYWLFTLHSRVLPNWIAPAVLPLLLLLVVDWEPRWRSAARWQRDLFTGGLALGLVAVVLLHETNLIRKIAGRPLPPQQDPLRRVRGWPETAALVEAARQKLAAEGRPVFIIGDHYGITGQLTFNLPAARAAVRSEPLVYFRSTDRPENQFYFWPGYSARKGQNAIFVRGYFPDLPLPERLRAEFSSIRDLGPHDVVVRGVTLRTLQLFECRDLR